MSQQNFDVDSVGEPENLTHIIWRGDLPVAYLPACAEKPTRKTHAFSRAETVKEVRELVQTSQIRRAVNLSRSQPFRIRVVARLSYGIIIEEIRFLLLKGQPCGFLVRRMGMAMGYLEETEEAAMALAQSLIAEENTASAAASIQPPQGVRR